MSISASLSNAVSGLAAASKAAELVSTNVANAMTEGYARRELDLSARTIGGAGAGVQIDGVRRAVDDILIRDRRIAEAAVAAGTTTADYFSRMSDFFGAPGSDDALTQRFAALEATLTAAASRPDVVARQEVVLADAHQIASAFREGSDLLQRLRLDADHEIERQVALLQQSLSEVATLNADILRLGSGNGDTSGLVDQRDQVLNRISEIVPIRTLPDKNGTIDIYTAGGATLLDGQPATLAYQPVTYITPDMTADSGALSLLTFGDRVVDPANPRDLFTGGRLEALFVLRDDLAPAFQEQLDGAARALMERFQDPAVDPSLSPGDPGLFTDRGAAFDPLNETGLAARIEVNALVDPALGGAIWRLQAGILAAAPVDAGDGAIFAAMAGAYARSDAPPAGTGLTRAVSMTGLMAELHSRLSQQEHAALRTQQVSVAKTQALRQAEGQYAVDTDQELQKLVLIERTYAANARVISVVDDLMDELLRL